MYDPPPPTEAAARRRALGLTALTLSTLIVAALVPPPTAAAAVHPSYSAGIGTLLIYTWLVAAPGTRLHRPRWEKTLMTVFLVAMPVAYVNSLLLTRAGCCLDTPGVGAPESIGAGWLPLELAGIPVFAALAAIGARRAPWLLGVGVMAHGLLWDSWHIGRAPFMPDWYSIACLIVDVGWGLWALGRVRAWREDGLISK